MKTPPLATLLCLVCLLFTGIRAQAQMFGSSHTIDSTTYAYASSSDDGTYQTDTYSDGNGASLSLRGRIGASVTLAEVTGAFSGYYNGSFQPLIANGEPAATSFTSPNGRTYTQIFTRTTYTVNLANDSLDVQSAHTVYAGADGGFHLPDGGLNGPITGSESGFLHNGSLLLNSSSSSDWNMGEGPTVELFGSTYHGTFASCSTTYHAGGTFTSLIYSSHASSEGGSWYQSSSTLPGQPASDSTCGSDPYVGNWALDSGSTFSAPQFAPRQSSKFAPPVFRVNGVVLSLAESRINDMAGNIIDSYTGNNITVSITGNARKHEVNAEAATMTVTIGGVSHTGSLLSGAEPEGFDPAVCDVRFAPPNLDTPCFSAAVLYVDGVPFDFSGGYDESSGGRTDLYNHDGTLLRLAGAAAAPSSASVTIGTHAGTMTGGVFDVPGHVIKTQALLEGPPAFWVHGVLYVKAPGTTTYESDAATPQTFTLSGEASDALSLSGTISSNVLTGSYNARQGGVFNVMLGGVSRLACPAEASGALRQGPALDSLNGTEGPHPEFAGLPAAARISISNGPQPHATLDFLGLAVDDDTTGDLVACYGLTEVVPGSDPGGYWQKNLHLLKIHPASAASKKVTLRDYKGLKTSDGSYDTSSRLFQTELRASNAAIKALPLPVMSLDPEHDYAFWFIDAPTGGLPRSFIIRGQPWWYAGEPSGQPVYRGFYAGQQMTLGATPDANGQRMVSLTDLQLDENGNLKPNTTETSQGMLSGVRGSIRFRNNTLALTGSENGAHQKIIPTFDNSLHTIRSDVDILGNNLSFGLLNNDASLAGALFQFVDMGGKAGLHSTLSSPVAEWIWWKRHESQLEAVRPVMVLGQDHVLQLYPSAASLYPGVVLNPSGTSSFKGPVRVQQGGDISMGAFMEGTPP